MLWMLSVDRLHNSAQNVRFLKLYLNDVIKLCTKSAFHHQSLNHLWFYLLCLFLSLLVKLYDFTGILFEFILFIFPIAKNCFETCLFDCLHYFFNVPRNGALCLLANKTVSAA